MLQDFATRIQLSINQGESAIVGARARVEVFVAAAGGRHGDGAPGKMGQCVCLLLGSPVGPRGGTGHTAEEVPAAR